jgi:hypothetical protein
VTFADISPRLRQAGVEVFLAQMRRQRDDVRSLIKDSATGAKAKACLSGLYMGVKTINISCDCVSVRNEIFYRNRA